MADKLHNIPVAMDSALLGELDSVAAEVKDSRSGVMRRAIRAGLPLVKSGGEVVRISGPLADDVAALVARFAEIPGQKRSREAVLLEAIQRGLRAVEVAAMIEDARARGISEADLAVVLTMHGADTYPEKRVVREALQAKGAAETKLADLLNHCEDAKDRADTIEKLVTLARQVRGAWPSVWGSGAATAELKRQLAELERDAAGKAGAAPPAPVPAPVPAPQSAPAKPAKRKARQ